MALKPKINTRVPLPLIPRSLLREAMAMQLAKTLGGDVVAFSVGLEGLKSGVEETPRRLSAAPSTTNSDPNARGVASWL